jgi:phosphoribosylformylglycinamidine synthase
MGAVAKAPPRGRSVLGVCNGFQVLTEAGLLPGALIRNAGLDFVCRDVDLVVENAASRFTRAYAPHEAITVPVAHHDGNTWPMPRRSPCWKAKAASPSATPATATCASTAPEPHRRHPERQRHVLGLMPHPSGWLNPPTGAPMAAGCSKAC